VKKVVEMKIQENIQMLLTRAIVQSKVDYCLPSNIANGPVLIMNIIPIPRTSPIIAFVNFRHIVLLPHFEEQNSPCPCLAGITSHYCFLNIVIFFLINLLKKLFDTTLNMVNSQWYTFSGLYCLRLHIWRGLRNRTAVSDPAIF